MATYEKNQLYLVPLAELQFDPTQPRKYMDPVALDELTASIKQMGIIEPVVCRQDPATGLVYTVAGERRCAAARKAGKTGDLEFPDFSQEERTGILEAMNSLKETLVYF